MYHCPERRYLSLGYSSSLIPRIALHTAGTASKLRQLPSPFFVALGLQIVWVPAEPFPHGLGAACVERRLNLFLVVWITAASPDKA